jgi:hypothetical protein
MLTEASVEAQVTLAKVLAQRAIAARLASSSASDGMTRTLALTQMMAAIGSLTLILLAMTTDERELVSYARKLSQ